MSKYNKPQDVQPPAQGAWKFIPEVKVFTHTEHDTLQTMINLWLLAQIPLPYTTTITDIKFSTCSPQNNVTEFSALIQYTITVAD